MRPRWIRRAAVPLGLVLLGVVLRLTFFRPQPVPVTVFRVASGRVEETVTNSRAGTVKSRRRATLSPETGGRVERLSVKEGARVRRGEVLMVIADADLKAQLLLQERSLAVARAAEREACRSAEQAVRDLTRSRSLHGEAILSQGLLEQAETQREVTAAACEASRSRVLQAEASVEVARVALSKTILRAPFDGVVARVSCEEGEWISPSPPALPIPPVVEMFDPAALYVSAPLDEADIGKVRTGVPVRVTMDAYPAKTFGGRVTRVAPYVLDVREQNRTLEIEVELDDLAGAAGLLPGTSADVVVVLDARENVLRIPAYALSEGSRVLVVADGKLEARKVTTGLKNWEFAEVRSGLAAGQLVVVNLDRAEVREGARVRVEGETLK